MSDRIPSFGGVSAFGAAPSGYIVAGATPLPSKTGPGPCGPDVSKCIYGALGVWTSADGRNWQPLAGIAQITGFQVLSVASDGTHAIVVVKDNGDRVQLLVGDGL